MKDYLVYDVETQIPFEELKNGWDDPFGMKISSAVVYSNKTDQFYFFGHTEEERIRLCEMLNNQDVVTFNGISFDSRVVLGNDRLILEHGVTASSDKKYQWRNIDIYVILWKRILDWKGTVEELLEHLKKNRPPKGVFNLDSILWATLKMKKNGDGKDAPMLFKTGDFRKLYEYNLQDVRCERDLYRFIMKYKYLINGQYEIVEFV
jgi:hypothetical protein